MNEPPSIPAQHFAARVRSVISRARNYLAGPGLGALLVKAVLGSAGIRIAGMGFGFLVGVQLARGLGVAGYGVYGIAMSIIALLTVPTEFGLPQLLTREVASAQVTCNWTKVRGVLHWASRAVSKISLAIAVSVVAWLLIADRGIESPLGRTLLSGLLLVPLVAQGNIRSATLRGLQHIVKGQLPDALFRPALYSLLLFLMSLLVVPLSPAIAMGLGSVSAAFALVIATLMLRTTMPEQAAASGVVIDARGWWADALPLALTEGMRVLQSHLVILLLGIMSTVAIVGVYRVASSVTLLVAMPVTLFNLVSAPIIARLYAEGDYRRLQRLLASVAVGMTLCILVLILPFFVVGDVMLGRIFGDDFSSANTTLLILGVGVLSNGLFGANSVLLNMTGHQARVTRASAISLTLLVVVLPPLVWFFGIIGAAVGSSLAMTAWNFLMWRDALRLLTINSCLGAIFIRERADEK
ncbi:lipopolysaccharide biosynthesis protein [Lysobacter sp. F6437]|uniref:lipopolysaccharide biosynthesis protein n=1 Tax=Lysobacter sp. F6437 TaxID=3459296 RepID=UPI00403E2116